MLKKPSENFSPYKVIIVCYITRSKKSENIEKISYLYS